MADEAFALSPISARAAQPSEEDYAAIHDAFMETSRGRWFLGEYAKRNRNADTRLVLDAVSRLEEGLAAQKQAAAAGDLREALAAISASVKEAQAAVNGGLDGLALDERMAPIDRGVRIIREISWRWRETGADGRICDILDSQAGAIEASAGHISLTEARTTIDRAFAAIEASIGECSAENASLGEPARPAAQANVVPFPVPVEEVAPGTQEATALVDPALDGQSVAELHVGAAAEAAEIAPAVTVELTADVATPLAGANSAIEFVDESAADSHDEAVLDLIAAEMSAPQEQDEDLMIGETAISPAEAPGPGSADAALDIAETISSPGQVDSPAAIIPGHAPVRVDQAPASIGAAVIASGMLKGPAPAGNDPLAPIRRMSQAERIAFFS